LDDNLYVYDNAWVPHGLTVKGVARVFTHVECNFYHPLTMVSLMLDDQLHGLHPGGYHVTNVLIHGASAVLLFLVLRSMTGAFWRSAFVAAVFAVHPLRAESVAWVTERKDVLGAFFFMVTLRAYVGYVRQPKSAARYAVVVGAFAVDLLCKPTAVTLPFLLLVLDYWPLGRMDERDGGGGGVRFWNLAKEKAPLLALAVAASVGAYFAQGTSVVPVAGIGVPMRLCNAVVSYADYLGETFWPSGLAIYYPYPRAGDLIWETCLALALLAAISGWAVVSRRKRPWLMAGWFWYLGMLVPLVGIVAVNPSGHGDRNTYLPQIGLLVMLAWAVADWSAGWKYRQAVLGGLMAGVIGALIFCAWIQTGYWFDSETLWRRALVCTENDIFAHNSLGSALFQKGRTGEAIGQYHAALLLKPDYADALNNLGAALLRQGKIEEAGTQFQLAVKFKPGDASARNNLGGVLLHQGKFEEAIVQFQQALQSKPGNAGAHINLGSALFQTGRIDEGIAQDREGLTLRPDNADAHYNLGSVLCQTGKTDEGIAQFRQALQLKPDHLLALGGLGAALSGKRDFEGAIAQYAKLLQIAPGDAETCGKLAAVYAEAGRYGEAAATARRGVELAKTQENEALAAALEKALSLYEAGAAAHELKP
jgi:tetratricopeptide (TPR) repeat protein